MDGLKSPLSDLLMFFIAGMLLAAIPARAAHYELVGGKDIEVCRAYEKNLNSFKPRVPMSCARPVNKKMKDFAKPKWVERDVFPSGETSFSFYKRMGDLLWQRDANPAAFYSFKDWPAWHGAPAQMAKARHNFDEDRNARRVLSPLFAEFDIDNDKVAEPVYFEQPCGSGSYGALLAVLKPDYSGIDRVKTERVMPHPPFTATGRDVFRPVKKGDADAGPIFLKAGYRPIEDAVHYLYYDVFFYKGVTYLDQWWRSRPGFKGRSDMEIGRLRIFRPGPKVTPQVCSYRFVLINDQQASDAPADKKE